MTNKFFLPAATFLSGFGLWLAYLAWTEWSCAVGEQPAWWGVGVCLLVGGLVVFSARACNRAGGPVLGSYVRGGLLLVLAALTVWRIGWLAGGVLALAALGVGCLACGAGCRPDDSSTKS
ncbi:MAG: hypothetical protein WC326_09960 [Candidatus Delongbacteria bacterium]